MKSLRDICWRMKEILYIQAGTLPNYIGTHFWNTQESYFTYEEHHEPDVEHDISFREGQNSKEESTYCPRLLLFDRKSQFGGASETNGLYGEDEDTMQGEDHSALWNGSVLEVRQTPAPKSVYHARLEAGTDEVDHQMSGVQDEPHYWSDYSRVFLHPRSLQKLPDLPEWDSSNGEWGKGQEEFARFNEENDLMEDAFRLSVEECDNLQGIQMTSDISTFGGFSSSFLTAYRDEFPKLPCLNFSLLSSSFPAAVDFEQKDNLRQAVNDALALHTLSQLSSLSIPLQRQSLWPARPLSAFTSAFNRTSLYHTAALLSTHVESATLPLRLKGTMEDLNSFCDRLSLSGTARFANLSGLFPLSSPVRSEFFEDGMMDFSALPSKDDSTKLNTLDYARIYVSRSFTGVDRRTFDTWAELRRRDPYIIHAPPYPVPSSFPSSILSNAVLSSPSKHPASQAPSASSLPTTRVLSSLHTSSSTAALVEAYARLVDEVVRRRDEVVGRLGMEVEDMREVVQGLWEVRDALAQDEESMDVEEMGEDEE